MTTMADMVTLALKRLRVINPRKVPDAAAAAEGLSALNAMMHSWKGQAVDIDHVDLEASDDFPLGEEHVQGVAALLAIRLAGDYGVQIDQGIVRDAEMGWSALEAEFIDPPDDAEADYGLRQIGRWGVGWDGTNF